MTKFSLDNQFDFSKQESVWQIKAKTFQGLGPKTINISNKKGVEVHNILVENSP